MDNNTKKSLRNFLKDFQKVKKNNLPKMLKCFANLEDVNKLNELYQECVDELYSDLKEATDKEYTFNILDYSENSFEYAYLQNDFMMFISRLYTVSNMISSMEPHDKMNKYVLYFASENIKMFAVLIQNLKIFIYKMSIYMMQSTVENIDEEKANEEYIKLKEHLDLEMLLQKLINVNNYDQIKELESENKKC